MTTCDEHGKMCEKLGKIEGLLQGLNTRLDQSFLRMEAHINEGERPGGVRDRVAALEADRAASEKEISTIKQGYWKACIVSGVVGGLLARLAPEAIWLLINNLLKSV
jgi:hypothetical protein